MIYWVLSYPFFAQSIDAPHAILIVKLALRRSVGISVSCQSDPRIEMPRV